MQVQIDYGKYITVCSIILGLMITFYPYLIPFIPRMTITVINLIVITCINIVAIDLTILFLSNAVFYD